MDRGKKMRLEEALSVPKGMDFVEYEKLLNEKKKLEKQINRLSNQIFDEEDSLEVLSDEVGSEKYNKHLQSKQKAEAKIDKAKEKLNEIIEKIS